MAEAAAAAAAADHDAEADTAEDGISWLSMMRVLEERELTEVDICREALDGMPEWFEPETWYGAETISEDPPPCTTLADCLLRRAAALGRVQSASLLLHLGARLDFAPSVLQCKGCLVTPLVSACEAGHLDVAQLLLEKRANVNAWTRCCQLQSVDECFYHRMDWTALHAACAWGSFEVVELLVGHHADPNLCCRYSRCEWEGTIDESSVETAGPNAFHLACARGHLSIVAFLHETADVDIEAVGSMYGFSLLGAQYLWGIDKVHNPYENDKHSLAYLTFPDAYGMRPMDNHNRSSEFPVVCVDVCKLYSGAALLLACVRSCTDVVQFLLEAGADMDACGADGLTPMSVLKEFEHTELSELLLKSAAASSGVRKEARTTPIKTRAQRVGLQLEETPPAVHRDLAEGGPDTHAKAKAQMRAIQKSRVQRVTRAEQAGTVSAKLMQIKHAQRQALKRADESCGSRRAYRCKKCGQPKKGHVCKSK